VRRTVERELKLTPTDSFDLSELGGVQLPNRDFVSTYFDSAELSLARAGITLRHRAEGGAGLWQLKVPSGAARIELEVTGAPARPPDELLALVVVHLRGTRPTRVARLRTRRRTVRMDGAEVVEDSVAVLDGQRVKTRFRELEVELLDASDERELARLERTLLRAGAEQAEFQPKIFRALGLDLTTASAPLPADATALEVLAAALAEQHRKLLDHDPGTRLGTDAEDLHQMRVATRRARAFLRVSKPLLDPTWTDELRAELDWLGSVLGPARDLDVLLARMQSEISKLGDDGATARGLVTSLERQRRRARSKVVAALSAPRYLELVDQLAAPPLPGSTGTNQQLAELWWAEFARAKKKFARLDDNSSDEELHAARIRVKRARYAAELAASELGNPGERFVDAAKIVQDVLGEHQDAAVAEERIRTWSEGKPDAAAAVRKLLKRERARRKKARAEWPDAWKDLKRRAKKARR
jgi:CHAD domain-containing protein